MKLESLNYKISSRATILLGRESVSKVDGAIIELVKNTYDADALICLICFDIENDCIYIFDNGVGMTRDVIENQWMLIGTDNKKYEYKSARNRIKSGEKGIGRFALDRLGSKCEMYTKNNLSTSVIYWETDWVKFEEPGKTLDEIHANIGYLDDEFKDVIPEFIKKDLLSINENKILNEPLSLESGTLLRISGLRDRWTIKEIDKITELLGYLIPPAHQKDFVICIKKSPKDQYLILENEITDEYDYKIYARFNGEKFTVILDRNEFDLNRIPKEVFELDAFRQYPYRYEDFKNRIIKFEYSISELMNTEQPEVIKLVREIGSFSFNYTFMKLSLIEDSKETFYYKEISSKRRIWMKNYGGIKLYRDNFLVRPYGDPNTDAFDWLGLDARRAENPAGISHLQHKWHVRNLQGHGAVLISRVDNSRIIDISNREGIIENEHFFMLKKVLTNIISIFEHDRQHIARGMKVYSDIINEKEKTKREGKNIATKILNLEEQNLTDHTKEDMQMMAKAIQYYEEERDELISEIKLLRSLATNGLITSSIVHDLKGINATLVERVKNLEFVINNNINNLITRHLNDLMKNDIYLKSWITVITNQIKKDKRKRVKKDVYQTIQGIVDIMQPILKQKKIKVEISFDEKQLFKRIFVSDFESIIYNLIINSIEAFESAKVSERTISINLETNDNFIIHYNDNGPGLGDKFKNPYDIFKFGVTSKYDNNGEVIGTGLGMHIVASTAREYNARYIITETKEGFGIDIIFPL